ncbi:MAG: SDR family NAD(P)-dependent oxidoreductase [Caulobacteraceae bacterium]|nr:SDR family NAD(P)-dependent oxidoreductase [Caulobacteraceae bacterium]
MGFGAQTTTDEVLQGVDLSGKFAVVTGGTTGLGLETCRALAAHGAEILLTARDAERGAAAVAHVRAHVPEAKAAFGLLDLGDLASVRRFAEQTLADHDRIDLLINNAGMMGTPFGRTKEGFETQFGCNHLGHFLLTNLLAPALLKGAPSRVVCLSSAGHHWSDVHWDDPNFERDPYDKWQAYGQSKTANALFALELDRRLSGRGVHAYSVHPGGIRTELGRHFTDEDRNQIERFRAAASNPQPKSIAAGASSTVWAATAPELADQGGVYIEDCAVAAPANPGERRGYAAWMRDTANAQRLWRMSEQYVGQTFEA